MFKLGKLAKREDPRTLKLARFLTEVFTPPAANDWTAGRENSAWGMLLNDQLGDCTCAALGHMLQVWRDGFPVSDAAITALYAGSTGYDPISGSHDNGAAMLDVLRYVQKNSLLGQPVRAFVEVERSIDHMQAACELFGGVYIGLQLPLSAQDQDIWDVADGAPATPGSWGGHAVNIVAYDPCGGVLITWGQRKRFTWEFLGMYCDEAYALLTDLWAPPAKLAACGLDMDALKYQLQNVQK